ncbi:collagen-binding protein [Niabella soli DSM 19437]|uniref:Collagen-binding protein n=1 Tax=Niabella soli DSM 19437 TaxID=929713 RepID=W0F5G3_9BACT|nr:collagen-binding protein [Niabella soli DSM 19437]
MSGTIRDESGQPLTGITVAEKGTKNTVMTGAGGAYTIAIKPEATIVVTGIGYETTEVRLTTDQNVLDITLKKDVKGLEDVVVVGYGSQNKTKVTGAVSTIKMEGVLGDRPVSNLGVLLQGASPGLQVTINSGKPGASSSWNIRGGTDFGSGTTSGINSGGPFILVDNVPYNGPTNLLDPNDIETVTVLKDAGAAAIYGARSAFGVVLITTKSGKKNTKTQFNYSDNFVISTPINLPQKATPLQQVQAWIDGGMASVYNGNQNLATWTEFLKEYDADPSKYPLGYTQANGVFYQLKATDPVKDLLGNHAFQQMHNFSVNGGTEKTTYRLSLGTTNENGILVPQAHQDNFSRYNIKSIVTSDVASWLNMQLDANYSSSNTLAPFYTNAFGNAVNLPSALATDSIPGLPGILNTAKNQIMATAPTTTRYDDIRITGRAVIKPVKGVTITGEYTIDNNFNKVTTYDKKVGGFINPYGYTAETIGSDNFSKSNASTRYNALNVFGNYVKAIDRHNFTLTAGYNQEENNYEIQSTTASGMLSPDLPFLSGTTGLIPFKASDNYLDYATQGFFGRLNYDFGGKYLFQVNGRYDGSSKFPKGSRWGFFPSVSAGWRITEEEFMQRLKPYLNELKLRASYGSVGNQNISDYQFFAGMTSYIPNWLYNGTQVGTLNPPILVGNFTWETVATKDFGVDFGFLRNRLTGAFDWYQRDTKDILTTNPTPLPVLLGTGAPLQNAGSLRTKGFEIQLGWKDKIGKVGYYINGSLYNYNSVVTGANNPKNVITNGTLYNGKRMGEIWGYVTDRFYTTDDFVDGTLNANLRGGTLKPGIPKQNGQAPNPGDIVYKDFDGNGVITSGSGTLDDPGDYKIIGNSTPQYQYGVSGGVSYRNVEFSFVITGVGKQDIWQNNTLAFPNQWLTYGALYSNQLNYWTPANTNSYYGRIYTDNVNSPNQGYNQIVQTKFLYNGAYMRIQNLSLSYSIPQPVITKAHINKLQVFVSVENPYTFTHMPKGMYPDIAVQGSTAGGGLGYPFMRKTSFGVNVSF